MEILKHSGYSAAKLKGYNRLMSKSASAAALKNSARCAQVRAVGTIRRLATYTVAGGTGTGVRSALNYAMKTPLRAPFLIKM